MASAEQIQQYEQKWAQAADTAFAVLDSSDWDKQKSKDKDCEIYLRHEKGSSFAQVKSVVTINAPISTVEENLKTTKVVDKNTPKEEREGNIERRIVSQVNDGADAAGFFYIAVESPSSLVSPREFLMYQKLTRRDGKIALIRTSIENDDIQKTAKGNVRGNMHFQAFIAESVNDSTTKLCFVCHADPCGKIPSMVYNSAATNQGYSALRLKRDIEK
ncbi:hypothetical protein TRFO_37461 [Tritrichomonas foetus]|uniref:START domain-containing protein n=1 Tax=Tritrichomonas foetus TaxID=1144522 RepID=A0A1J4JCJ5_9EUKA|nr:hypothetical protein TRFO_37461 [Tritrichomonas foetus]|eukprot:OHS96393.1 hypothetical protein TRFO_37461 [Tritrichomonas foetus]